MALEDAGLMDCHRATILIGSVPHPLHYPHQPNGIHLAGFRVTVIGSIGTPLAKNSACRHGLRAAAASFASQGAVVWHRLRYRFFSQPI